VNEKEKTWEEPTVFYYKDDVDLLISQMEQQQDGTKKELAQWKNRYNLLSESKGKADINALIRKRALWSARRNICRYFNVQFYLAKHPNSHWSIKEFCDKLKRAEDLCLENMDYLEQILKAYTGNQG
jgi:hypothetical protein